jgi:uncharacterized membrane protein YraQ (UPF0718 family)
MKPFLTWRSVMELILNVVIGSIGQVWVTLLHNWPYLVASVVIATLLKLYVNTQEVSAFLDRYRGAGIVAATTAAVGTPFCSCGTTAVILGMMASKMPWGPIVAFMVASPLTSPQELVYSAGLFGWPFALAFYLASILLGLVGGWAAAVIERRGWLANQARFTESVAIPSAGSVTNRPAAPSNRDFNRAAPTLQLSPCACAAATGNPLAASCGCDQTRSAIDSVAPAGARTDDRSSGLPSASPTAARGPNVSLGAFVSELWYSGSRLLAMFVGFAFIGYVLNGLIPATWVAAAFGPDKIYNAPLAATLGLPLYVNAEASLPLVRALLENGMSQGAALAFLISGAGTSIGAMAGALTIARWRVVALVVGILWVGAMLCGLAFNLALLFGLF